MKHLAFFLFILFAFIAGILASHSATLALAHGGDVKQIHACVKTNNGTIRIVGAASTCDKNETALDWNIQGVPGPTSVPGTDTSKQLPFICKACSFRGDEGFPDLFKGKSLKNAFISYVSFYQTDLSNTDFNGAYLQSASFDTLTLLNNDFTNANMAKSHWHDVNITNAKFVNGTFTDATCSNVRLENSNFTGANWSSTSPNELGCNFIHANFTNANFSGTQMTILPENESGIIWSNTTCPDGTNSDNNGNTCLGHLIP